MYQSHAAPALSTNAQHASTDAALVKGLLADNADAWRAFHGMYSELLKRCIGKVLARFRSVVSEDDVQESYCTLCVQLLARDKRKLRAFDPARGVPLRSWLAMLANHSAYDLLRNRRRRPSTIELDPAIPVVSEGALPDELCAARQATGRLQQLMLHLSEKDQQFVRLYFGEGLDPELVAEEMGISVKTVYSKKHKVRARLARLLGEEALAA